jgi:hypothetical protein
MTIPAFLPYYVLTGTAAMLFAILYGLNRALSDAAWPDRDRVRTVSLAAAILLGWLAASIALAAQGAYRRDTTSIPTIQYGVLIPIVFGVLLIWRSRTVKRILDAVPQAWLVGVQLYRALGVIFLILYASGTLPGLFACPAGAGDIAVGLLAPVVGVLYARAPRDTAGLVTAWNGFGILDLMVAVTAGFLTAPSLLQPAAPQPTSELMTVLPMVLIPVYLVPLSILLHVASLTKLARTRTPQTKGKSAATASI